MSTVLCAVLVAVRASIAASVAASAVAADPPTRSAPVPAVAPSTAPGQALRAPAESPAMGWWQGSIEAEGGTLFVAIEITPGDSAPNVLITAPKAGAIRTKAKSVLANDRAISFTLDSRGMTGRFRGDIAADGQSYVGSLELGRAGAETKEVPFTLARVQDPRSAEHQTRWEGQLDVGQMKLPMSFTIAEFGPDRFGGVVDIPLQSLEAFPVLVTKSTGDDGSTRWTFVLPVGVDATVDLVQADADTLRGKFRQGAADLPIELKKSAGASSVALNRPQTPKPPFPYRQRDALVGHRFGHALGGTLTLPARTPESPEKFPAVILVSGSGPQDRDETLFGHKLFAVLADALARAGVAVFRYDDRGVGLSTGDFGKANTYDFATDTDEVSEWLKRQPEIDAMRVGIIGHSEGGIIAPIVASWQWVGELNSPTPIAFIVLLAGPGVNGKEILKVQTKRLLLASGVAPDDVTQVAEANAALTDAATTPGTPAEEVLKAARELVVRQTAIAVKLGQPAPTEAQIDQTAAMAVGQMESRWMKTFLTLEPALWIASLHIPILTMNGTLDTQVDLDQNVPMITKAAEIGGAPLTAKRYEGLNHLFQPAKTGSVEEYAAIETTIDPTALKDLVDWVVARGKAPPPTSRGFKAPESNPATALPEVRSLPSSAPATAPAPAAAPAPTAPMPKGT